MSACLHFLWCQISIQFSHPFPHSQVAFCFNLRAVAQQYMNYIAKFQSATMILDAAATNAKTLTVPAGTLCKKTPELADSRWVWDGRIAIQERIQMNPDMRCNCIMTDSRFCWDVSVQMILTYPNVDHRHGTGSHGNFSRCLHMIEEDSWRIPSMFHESIDFVCATLPHNVHKHIKQSQTLMFFAELDCCQHPTMSLNFPGGCSWIPQQYLIICFIGPPLYWVHLVLRQWEAQSCPSFAPSVPSIQRHWCWSTPTKKSL